MLNKILLNIKLIKKRIPLQKPKVETGIIFDFPVTSKAKTVVTLIKQYYIIIKIATSQQKLWFNRMPKRKCHSILLIVLTNWHYF